MTVKEIIKKTATLSGREDVAKYLSKNGVTATEETLSAIDVMVRLLNMVISELSASFIPMVTLERVNGKTTLNFDELSKKIIEVLKVYDSNGKEIDFKLGYDHVKASSPIWSIEYKFHPDTYGLQDEIYYKEKDIPEAVIAYGLAAEFALSEGDFDRACSLHDRYVEGVHTICKPKNKKIKERDWQ